MKGISTKTFMLIDENLKKRKGNAIARSLQKKEKFERKPRFMKGVYTYNAIVK